MFGQSWMSSAVGYLVAVVIVIQQSVVSGSPLPHTVEGWVMYATAIIAAVMGRVSIDPKPK